MSAVADTVFAMMVAAGVTGLAVDSMVKVAPKPVTADFFDVREIKAERDGSGALLWIDRDIHRAVYMAATVRIMAQMDSGWREYCIADGPTILYNPAAVLDQPVTLDWWSFGQCPSLPPQRAMIETTWAPRDPALDPVTVDVTVE